ncbi:MAG: hypothetical protein AMXMBFR72_20400 [Betaproteobacteria bacterium]|jgi:hypothetical protein|nr:MAG: hypothetical protein BroJett031_31300 [Betaproteobacteria bacterium]
MSKRTRRSLAAFALAFGAGTAAATTVEQCKWMLTALEGQTNQVELIGRNADKDERALLGKVTEAQAKFALSKFVDSTQKLADYQTKLTQVSFAPTSTYKLSDLMLSSNETIACINNIGR